MTIKQYDTVLLKDGREACIVEAFDNKVFLADIGDSPADWETIEIGRASCRERVSSPV